MRSKSQVFAFKETNARKTEDQRWNRKLKEKLVQGIEVVEGLDETLPGCMRFTPATMTKAGIMILAL